MGVGDELGHHYNNTRSMLWSQNYSYTTLYRTLCLCVTYVILYLIIPLSCPLLIPLITYSETTPEGRKITKLDQILLNGNNITMLVPGGEYPLTLIFTWCVLVLITQVCIMRYYLTLTCVYQRSRSVTVSTVFIGICKLIELSVLYILYMYVYSN